MDVQAIEARLVALKKTILLECETFKKDTGFRVCNLTGERSCYMMRESEPLLDDVTVVAIKDGLKLTR